MTTLKQTLIEIFNQAAEGHAFAYVLVDGADDDWPYWYAGFAQQRLSRPSGGR